MRIIKRGLITLVFILSCIIQNHLHAAIDPIITPTTLSCGTTTVTIDYGCDWIGNASIGFPNGLPSGVTYTGTAPIVIQNGVGITSFDVAPGVYANFEWEISVGLIFLTFSIKYVRK